MGSHLTDRTVLILAVAAFLPLQPGTQTPEQVSRPSVQIVAPTPGQRYRVTDPTIELTVRIASKLGLQEVEVEVIGENTGTFFTICSPEEQPCTGEPPAFNFRTSCPVFDGANVVKVRAVDREKHQGDATVEIHVLLSTESPGSSTPPAAPTAAIPAVSILQASRDRYDLLILTHEKPFGEDFKTALQPLVAHKNSTGMPTILQTLEELYETPALRGVDHPEIIKKAIEAAYKKWGIRYVMLVGDSDRFPVRYTRSYDLGHWGHGFAPSDLYYADLFRSDGTFDSWDYDNDGLFGELQGNFAKSAQDLNQDRVNLLPDVAVGRVPASSLQELKDYVQKIVTYETTADASWFKKALLITGDYPSSNSTNDTIGTQLSSKSFKVIKQYHNLVWPSTTLAQRNTIIETALNDGVGFVSYVGHGWGPTASTKDGGGWGGWWDYKRVPYLANQSKLPVVFSAACETGMFHFGYGTYYAKWGFEYKTSIEPAKYRWAPEPNSFSPSTYDKDAFAEHLLVKGRQGAVGFIGAYTGTQGDSHTLAKNFFSAYAAGAVVLGDAWNGAIKTFVTGVINNFSYPGDSWHTAARYHHIHKMLLFGDPSLRLGGLQPDLSIKADASGGFCRRTSGKLLVTVVNSGNGKAAASTTEVDFGRYGKVTTATRSLGAGETQDLLVEVPAKCFDPDCSFRITVDAGRVVAEANEANNTADGSCVG